MNPWLDGLAGGWMFSGTARIQSGDLFDLGNVRIVGMSRGGSARRVPSCARSTPPSPTRGPRTSSTRRSRRTARARRRRPATARSGRPAAATSRRRSTRAASRRSATTYGDCGVRSFIVRGPMRVPDGLELPQEHPVRRQARVRAQRRHLQPAQLHAVGGERRPASATTLDDYDLGLPGSQRRMQIGTRFTF